MNIVVAVRCYNESKNITRFLMGYDFCDQIVISDGGSTDNSVDIIKYHQKYNPKIHLLYFDQQETVNGETWNPDAPHMNYVINAAKELKPDFLIFDDADCFPTAHLKREARYMFSSLESHHTQVNLFRLYMWGENRYFPFMNRDFDLEYTSLWAWRPEHLDIHADENVRHGTLVGLSPSPYRIEPPSCLLHHSWSPETIKAKMKRYNELGIPMNHPFCFAGRPKRLPEWAIE